MPLSNDYQQTDLKEGEVVALTFQRNDIASLTTRQADFSNQFTLPPTLNNQELLKNNDDNRVNDYIPRQRLFAKILVDGVVVLDEGKGHLKSTDNGYNIEVTGNITDFFTKIKGKTLEDLNLSDYDHTWDLATVEAKQNVASGVVYALAEYGTGNGKTIARGEKKVYADFCPPSFYLKTLVQEIIEQAGYSWDSSDAIWTDTMATKVVLLYSRNSLTYLPAEDLAQREMYFSSLSLPTTGSTSGSEYDITYGASKIDPDTQYLTPKYFKANYDGVVTVQIYGRITNTTSGNTITIRAYKNAVLEATNVATYTIISTASHDLVDTDFQIDVAVDDELHFTFEIDKTGASAFWSIQVDYLGALNYGTPVSVKNLFPEGIKQTDLIKGFMELFALIPYVDQSGTQVKFFMHKDINSNYEDWSDKLHRPTNGQPFKSNFHPTTYARRNFFQYTPYYERDESFARGEITINDSHIDEEKVVVDSMFTASRHMGAKWANQYTRGALVPLWDESGNEIGEDLGGLRIGFIDIVTDVGNIIFTDTSTATSSGDYGARVYFEDEFESLNWETNIANYYGDMQTILTDFRLVECKMRLTPADINQLDFFSVKVIDGNYYYLNRIVDWIPGELATVELLKY